MLSSAQLDKIRWRGAPQRLRLPKARNLMKDGRRAARLIAILKPARQMGKDGWKRHAIQGKGS